MHIPAYSRVKLYKKKKETGLYEIVNLSSCLFKKIRAFNYMCCLVSLQTSSALADAWTGRDLGCVCSCRSVHVRVVVRGGDRTRAAWAMARGVALKDSRVVSSPQPLTLLPSARPPVIRQSHCCAQARRLSQLAGSRSSRARPCPRPARAHPSSAPGALPPLRSSLLSWWVAAPLPSEQDP